MEYVIVKWLHILSSTLLFGTGLGSAFYMLFVSRTRDAHAIAVVARYVVMADWAFTTPTVIIQPLTGFYLVVDRTGHRRLPGARCSVLPDGGEARVSRPRLSCVPRATARRS